MYKEYFGLDEMPFSIAPDPRYLYMSEQHREALAHLLYGFNSDGGFVLVTGEVGTGKTTVCRCLLEQIPDNSAIAFIINPKLTVEELLATVCDEFGIQYPAGNASIKTFVDLINNYLLEAHIKGQKAILIIDEAQNLSADVLEQLRLLTNLETNQVKLLQIILLGQPELRDKLSQPELRQLSQRVIARYHLGPLSKKDVTSYVAHRLTVAGVRNQLFSDSAVNKIYNLSGGIPRLINVLCDRALLGAFAHGKKQVNISILKKAAQEVFGENNFQKHYKKALIWLAAITLSVIVGAVLASNYFNRNEPVKSQLSATDMPKVVAPSPLPNKLEWPSDLPIDQSGKMAYESLFNQWGIRYNPQEILTPCEQARKSGMQCLDDIGSLNTLRQLNLPAVLKFYDDKGGLFYGVLIVMKDKIAGVKLGSKTAEVSLNDIESHWLGNFTLLWKTPPDYEGDILPGRKGPSIQWLNTQLSALLGRQVQPQGTVVYNDELVREVKKFQLSQGLKPDGIVGVHTMIRLSTVNKNDTPLLDNNSHAENKE